MIKVKLLFLKMLNIEKLMILNQVDLVLFLFKQIMDAAVFKKDEKGLD